MKQLTLGATTEKDSTSQLRVLSSYLFSIFDTNYNSDIFKNVIADLNKKFAAHVTRATDLASTFSTSKDNPPQKIAKWIEDEAIQACYYYRLAHLVHLSSQLGISNKLVFNQSEDESIAELCNSVSDLVNELLKNYSNQEPCYANMQLIIGFLEQIKIIQAFAKEHRENNVSLSYEFVNQMVKDFLKFLVIKLEEVEREAVNKLMRKMEVVKASGTVQTKCKEKLMFLLMATKLVNIAAPTDTPMMPIIEITDMGEGWQASPVAPKPRPLGIVRSLTVGTQSASASPLTSPRDSLDEKNPALAPAPRRMPIMDYFRLATVS